MILFILLLQRRNETYWILCFRISIAMPKDFDLPQKLDLYVYYVRPFLDYV
jgi:hypothetical protein